MLTSIISKRSLFVILLALFLNSTGTLAKIKITTGTTEKKQRLIQMLQYGTFPALPPAGSINFDTLTGEVTLTGQTSTFFGLTLKKVLDDTTKIELSLDKSIDGRAIFIGGFNAGNDVRGAANGKQSIDINDLNRLDSVGYHGLGSWLTFLMHEIYEQYTGYKYGLHYEQAHDSALAVENETIFRIGGIRYKREIDVRDGDTIYLIYKRDGTTDRIGLKFRLDVYGQVQSSSSGIINDLKTRHISGGCSGGLCGFNEGNNGIIYEPVPGSELLSGAEYLITDEKGNIYAALPLQGKVLRMNHSGQVDRQYIHSSLSFPSGMAYDPISEELFVACSKQNHVTVFDVSGTYKRVLSPRGLEMAAGMDIDPDGNLYVSSHGSDSIIYMDKFGEVIRRIGNALLQGPAGLVYADGKEKLYVVSNTNNKILVFNRNGSFSEVFGSGTVLSSPWGISIAGGKIDKTHPAGANYTPIERIAVTNSGTNGIIIFNPDGTVRNNLSQNGFQPKAMLITKSISYSLIGINKISTETPSSFNLQQNYPNPFNPSTKIKFSITNSTSVKLIVYDITGREIKILVDEKMNPGTYEADFDGTNLSAGVYFYRITTGDFSTTKKMIMVK